MKHKYHSVADFLQDEFFKEWIKKPSLASDEYWHNFVARHPERKQYVDKAREAILAMQFGEDIVSEEEIAVVRKNILAGKKSRYAHASLPKAKNNRTFIPWYWNAAAILLVVLGGILWLAPEPPHMPEKISAYEQMVKETLKGQKTRFALPDGSKVWLNAESRMEFTKPFSPDKREVTLQGEAFFEVTPNKKYPFVIKSGEVTTTVLGTTFNVRAYPSDSMIRVSVASGQVQVAACKAEEMVLHPSEQANFHKNTKSVVREIFDPLDILGWKDGLLFFRKASFPEIVDELERWYGVEILVKGMPKPRRFSGEFRQQSLENVLKGIGFSLGFDFTIAGDTVQIIHQ